jgi:hypothetical protein
MARAPLKGRVGKLQTRLGRNCPLCNGRGKVTVSRPDDGDAREPEPCPSCGRTCLITVRYDSVPLPERAGVGPGGVGWRSGV